MTPSLCTFICICFSVSAMSVAQVFLIQCFSLPHSSPWLTHLIVRHVATISSHAAHVTNVTCMTFLTFLPADSAPVFNLEMSAFIVLKLNISTQHIYLTFTFKVVFMFKLTVHINFCQLTLHMNLTPGNVYIKHPTNVWKWL